MIDQHFFEKENFELLNDFYVMLQKDNVALIIVSINPTFPMSTYDKKTLDSFGKQHKGLIVVIDKFNDMLQKFASSHKDVYYFDVSEYFDKIGREGLFIDDSCHLSEEGSEKQADFIVDELIKNGLL